MFDCLAGYIWQAAEGANDADAQPVASRRGAGAKSAAKKSKTAAPAAVASQPQPQPAVEATAAATDSGEAGSESAQNGNTATEPGKKRRGRKPSGTALLLVLNFL